jgi:hypothetical protein
LSAGTGSCALRLSVVGWRTLTATYSGDSSFFTSYDSKNQQVIYKFTGFLPPLKMVGDTSTPPSLEDDLIPIKWQLQDYKGNYISDLTVNTLGVSFVGPAPKNCVCPLPPPPNQPVANLIWLYKNGAVAQYSSFSYDTKYKQFVFKWNAEHFKTGCYILELDLNDGTVRRTSLRVYE